jgi:hypothetical protein
MPGLDPGIHQSSQGHFSKKMDCRVKPGNDGVRHMVRKDDLETISYCPKNALWCRLALLSANVEYLSISKAWVGARSLWRAD